MCVSVCVCEKDRQDRDEVGQAGSGGWGVIEDEDTSWQEASVVPACLKWLHSSV